MPSKTQARTQAPAQGRGEQLVSEGTTHFLERGGFVYAPSPGHDEPLYNFFQFSHPLRVCSQIKSLIMKEITRAREFMTFILHHVHHLDQNPGVLVFNLCICHTGDSAKLSVCYRCLSLAF
jgi:hypothetical protein